MTSADIVWSFIKMISALAVILGLLIGAMFFFKRFMKQTGVGMDQGELIRVVAARYLGPKSSIMLLDIAGQIVAVGVSHNQLTMLTTISDPVALERVKNIKGPGNPLPSFAEHILKYKTKLSAIKDLRGKGTVNHE